MPKKQKPFSGPYSWVIAYINTDYLDRIYRDLKKSQEYKDIEVYIPTVRILKKTFKKENFFQEVPLLFNYGFFKVPRKFAVYKSFLENMQKNISCIYAWVKDPVKVMGEKPILREDNKFTWKDKHVPVATATAEEITHLIQAAYETSLYNEDDIDKLKPGMHITLRGYPWDNLEVEVVEVYANKHKVKVKMRIFDQVKDVLVSFDNVFFTVYHNQNYDDTVTLAGSVDITAPIMENKIHKK